MKIAIICSGRNTDEIGQILVNSGHKVEVWPNISVPGNIDAAVCWKHPMGSLQSFSNLKLIASLGAGVDHLLSDSLLPESVPITRFTDPELGFGISKYVTASILNYHYGWPQYLANQENQKWEPLLEKPDLTVGIFGMGQLGQATARGLLGLGFSVVGYSRSERSVPGIECMFGDYDLFLKKINVLVCLAPLTPATRSLMNQEFFDKCSPGTYFINVARGELVDDIALLNSVDSGQLSGACLDVFSKEPLPSDHEFWSHPRITVTPHIASISNQKSFANQFLQNLNNLANSSDLNNLVDREKGY